MLKAILILNHICIELIFRFGDCGSHYDGNFIHRIFQDWEEFYNQTRHGNQVSSQQVFKVCLYILINYPEDILC